MQDLSNISVVLPSLDPDEKLNAVIDGLLEYGFSDIILVNDGSKPEKRSIFTEAAAAHPQIHLLEHEVNRGKGAALKTAFAWFLENRPEAFGRLDWNNAAKRNAEVVALTQEMEECIPDSWQDVAGDSGEISRLVSVFLRTQTPENRMIFVRRYWYGDSVSEIALRYEVSQSAVLMRLSRTRSKLAAYLKKEGICV